MRPFTYDISPSRVVFGSGTRHRLAEEIDRLGRKRALILTTPQQKDEGEALLEEISSLGAGVFSGARMHTPLDVTSEAIEMATALHADCVVAIGGGSTTGLGKAIAFQTDLPQIVLPTTYAGSEATNILGQSQDGEKTTLRSPRVLPEVILYDVDLTTSLPTLLSAVSGLNAIAHSVEALYAHDGNPVIELLSEEGIRAFAEALPAIMVDPGDLDARAQALYGSWLCGTCLNAVSMGLHHKLCHTLGGMLDLPHAETHSVILPHACEFNSAAAPGAMAKIARALGKADAPSGLFDLATALGAPTSLEQLGVDERRLPDVADRATQAPYPNPRKLTRQSILSLLEGAFGGIRPVANLAEET